MNLLLFTIDLTIVNQIKTTTLNYPISKFFNSILQCLRVGPPFIVALLAGLAGKCKSKLTAQMRVIPKSSSYFSKRWLIDKQYLLCCRHQLFLCVCLGLAFRWTSRPWVQRRSSRTPSACANIDQRACAIVNSWEQVSGMEFTGGNRMCGMLQRLCFYSLKNQWWTQGYLEETHADGHGQLHRETEQNLQSKNQIKSKKSALFLCINGST